MKVIRPPHNKVAKEVTTFTEDLKEEILLMSKMMVSQDFDGMTGMAVAHPQVSDDPYQIFVKLDKSRPERVKIVINPTILALGGIYHPKEGCLSFPGRKFVVPGAVRYRRIKVRYLDEGLVEHTEDLSGIEALVFQHEIEHFNGKNIYSEY